MSAPQSPMAGRTPQSLASWIRRGQWHVALVALLAMALASLLSGAAIIDSQTERKLDLLARTAAHTVEPAVVFRDAEAAAADLQNIAQREQLASIELLLGGDEARPFVSVHAPMAHHWLPQWAHDAGLSFLQRDASAAILLDGRVIGQVRVHSDGRELVPFIQTWLLRVVLAWAITLAAVAWVSRRTSRRFADEIAQLAAFTHEVREERAYTRRAPPGAQVAEIAQLSDDINALLGEMHSHTGELISGHETLRSRNALLQTQIYRDALTGLPNRLYFHERLSLALDQAQQLGQAVGVMFIDVDRFKRINDTLGHAAGDAVLVAIARRLQAALREGDVVARLGGDEFAVLLAPLPSRQDAATVMHKIDLLMRAPMDVAQQPGAQALEVSVSCGLAVYPQDGEDAAALLSSADRIMYDRKHNRNHDTV